MTIWNRVMIRVYGDVSDNVNRWVGWRISSRVYDQVGRRVDNRVFNRVFTRVHARAIEEIDR